MSGSIRSCGLCFRGSGAYRVLGLKIFRFQLKVQDPELRGFGLGYEVFLHVGLRVCGPATGFAGLGLGVPST